MAKITLFVGTGCSSSNPSLALEDGQCVSSMEGQQSQYSGKIASCIVESGVWLLYNGDDYSHGATVLPAGTYNDLGAIQGGHMHSSTSLRSIRPLPNPGAATIVLFQDTNFCGNSVVLDRDCDDLSATGTHNDLCNQGALSFGVSSAIVVSGKWTLFTRTNGSGDSQVVYHKDTSNSVQGVPGLYPSLQHNDGVRSVKVTEAHMNDSVSWMSSLPATTKLSALTIPGTHDSGAVRDTDRISQCQDMNASEQLSAGIRFFDIRLKLNGDNLEVYHGPEDQGTSFKDWGFACALFLHYSPDECVIMSIDNVGGGDPDDFEGAVKTALSTLSLGQFPLACFTENRIPTLGEVRGKVVLLRRFAGPDPKFGLACSAGWTHTDDPFTIQLNGTDEVIGQDNYDLAEMPDPNMDHKWGLVQAQLNAASGDQDGNHLYLNFASGAGDLKSGGAPWPVAVALGSKFLTHFTGSYEGINYRLMDLLGSSAPSGRLGVLVMDFPNKPDTLIQTIINLNFRASATAGAAQ